MVDGRRCSNWARRGSDPALCNVHGEGALPEGGKRRCSAVTAREERCRNWAMIGEDVCNIHGGWTMPPEADRIMGRACTAVTEGGRSCGRWATRGSDPPLCNVHAGNYLPGEGTHQAGQRCVAMTETGEQCNAWAMRNSVPLYGRTLCGTHAGLFRLPEVADYEANGRRSRRGCSARTAEGKRCPNWTLRDSDPPLCRIHAQGPGFRLPGPGDRAAGRQCTATTKRGKRCPHWAVGPLAVGDSDPPLCWRHRYPDRHPRIRHGYYRATRSLGEVERAAIRLGRTSGRPLDGEIVLARLMIGKVAGYLAESERPLGENLHSVRLILQDVRTVARLLLARKALEKGVGTAVETVPVAAVATEAVETETAALLAAGRVDELGEEIALVRVLLWRLLVYTNGAEGLRVPELARVTELVIRGVGVVAELMRSRRALQPDPAEELAALIDEVLDELEKEWGIAL